MIEGSNLFVRTVSFFLLSNFSYAEKAKIVSDQFRDQPRTPLETGMHWVKHVAKNKGALHLRSVAVDLPFYALYNLDVWAFIFAVFILTIFALVKSIRFVVSFVIGSNSSKKLKRG